MYTSVYCMSYCRRDGEHTERRSQSLNSTADVHVVLYTTTVARFSNQWGGGERGHEFLARLAIVLVGVQNIWAISWKP